MLYNDSEIHKLMSEMSTLVYQLLYCLKIFMRARTSKDNIICSFKLANKSPRQLVRIDESPTRFIYKKQQQQNNTQNLSHQHAIPPCGSITSVSSDEKYMKMHHI